jgi:hypothetical protein
MGAAPSSPSNLFAARRLVATWLGKLLTAQSVWIACYEGLTAGGNLSKPACSKTATVF